ISPDTLAEVPSVRVAADFTGQSLDRRRLGAGASKSDAHYGGRERALLRWGGDVVLEAERTASLRASTPSSGQRSRSFGRPVVDDYDDGFDPSLWGRPSDRTSSLAS